MTDDQGLPPLDENGEPYGIGNPRPVRYEDPADDLPFDDFLPDWTHPLDRGPEPARKPLDRSDDVEWAAPVPSHLDIDLDEHIPWAIGPCIAPGDCAYFVGKRSEGKTTLVADILWGAMAPPEFDDEDGYGTCLHDRWHINREVIPHGSMALVLNGETTSLKSWARKLSQCAMTRGVPPFGEVDKEIRQRVEFLNRDQVMLRKSKMKEDATRLGHWIGAAGYRLVIIDPIYNFFDPDDNGDSTFVNRGIAPLIVALKEYGITTLAIAHPNAIAMQKGRKGGPKLEQVYTPFGSTQQANIMDAAFGVARLDSDQQTVEILVTKSRRDTDLWIPKYDSRIRLTFSSSGGGYRSSELKGSGWEYADPTGGVVLGEKQRKMLCRLPEGSFDKEHVAEAGIRRQTWAAARDNYFIPQGIIVEELLSRPGAPKVYHWTDRGKLARLAAIEAYPYEVPKDEPEEKQDDAPDISGTQ